MKSSVPSRFLPVNPRSGPEGVSRPEIVEHVRRGPGTARGTDAEDEVARDRRPGGGRRGGRREGESRDGEEKVS